MQVYPINIIAQHLGIRPEQITLYGNYKAKVFFPEWNYNAIQNNKLILVTSITPTKSGNGKTTVTIGIGDALQRAGKRVVLALREPSMGPVFGKKGGGTGGGKSQLYPAADINLHFTGDFHAITSANNLLAALLDNYLYFKQNEFPVSEIYWRRVLDVNDRILRNIICGLSDTDDIITTGFDITAASEIMAILCLADSYDDLRSRISKIVLGTFTNGQTITPDTIGATGAIMAILKDALQPNLVQTLEGTPALVHGGPFANIAHGCNSIAATKAAMQLSDYTVTEAGFASDLGAEKFFDIKCRLAGLQPALSVLVITIQALKQHTTTEGATTIEETFTGGFKNIKKHVEILHSFNQKVLVVLNEFAEDTATEINLVEDWCEDKGIPFVRCSSFINGSEGTAALACKIVELTEAPKPALHFAYELKQSVEQKIETLVTAIYGGNGIVLSERAQEALQNINRLALSDLPVCVAKTQYSFTGNAKETSTYGNFTLYVDDLIINAGSGFIVAVCGDMVRMPALPKQPNAKHINLVNGEVTGLV